MTKWSIIIGMLGLLVTRVATTRLSLQMPHPISRRCWLLGLASLFPGWIVSFIGLLGSSVGSPSEASLPQPVILSSSAALFGVILGDFLMRRLEISARSYPGLTYWLLGAVSLVPAWLIALLSLGGN